MKPTDLDDPSPVEPDDAVLGRVHARSGAFRRRRRTQRLVSVGAGALVLVLAVVVALAVGGTSESKPSGPSPTTTTTQPAVTSADIAGTWRPVSIAGWPRPPATQWITFRNNRIDGNDGCNHITGTYELRGTSTHFDATTATLCAPLTPLAPTLRATTRVGFREGHLVLYAADGHELAELARAGVTARIELPSNTIVAGSTMKGRVVVDNETGHVIPAFGCGSLFAVQLRNRGYEPEFGWTLCRMNLDIPTEVSTYPVVVVASTLRIGTQGPLPPGHYEATLYQSMHVVPDPAPIPIQVTAPAATSDFSAADLEHELVNAGYSVTSDGTTAGGVLGSTTHLVCASGTQVRVQEYTDDAARRAVSDSISADGSEIRRGNALTNVEWIGPPHFFVKGRVIVLVLQDDAALVQDLTQIMGPTISPDAPPNPHAKAACG